MKTKNLLLGFAALLCAVGSAFASLLMTPPHYINVRYTGQANFTCSTLGTTVCTATGSTVCKVAVQGFQPTVYDIKTNATTCSTPVLSNTTVAAITKPGTIEEVR